MKVLTLDIYGFLWTAIYRRKELKSQTETLSICRQRKPGNILENIRKNIYVRDGCILLSKFIIQNIHNFLFLDTEIYRTQLSWTYNMIMNGIKTDGKGGLLPALDQDILHVNKQQMLKSYKNNLHNKKCKKWYKQSKSHWYLKKSSLPMSSIIFPSSMLYFRLFFFLVCLLNNNISIFWYHFM